MDPSRRAPRGARADDVLAAAAELFERSGYSATTMAQIGQAVGVLPGSLYHHFDSKEAIAIRLLERYDIALEDAARSPAPGVDAPADEPLRSLITGVVMASCAHAAAVRLRAREAPSAATARLRDALQHDSRLLDAAWDAAVAAAAPEQAGTQEARLFTFAVRRMAMAAPLYHLHADPVVLAGSLAEILLRGVSVGGIDESEIDGSEAARAVRETTAKWEDPSAVPDSHGAILAAARREFARRGFDATTMRDIGEAAGIPLGTVYRRFSGKEAILREIIDAFAIRLDGGVRAALMTGSSEIAALSALAFVLVKGRRCFPEESEILSLGWGERERGDSPLHEYFLQTDTRFGLLADTVARGVAAGSLRRVADPHLVAGIVRQLCWQPYPRTASVDDAHRFARGILLRGYAPGAASEAS